MKPDTIITYLKKIQKTYKSRKTPLKFCCYQQFLSNVSNFCNIGKYR